MFCSRKHIINLHMKTCIRQDQKAIMIITQQLMTEQCREELTMWLNEDEQIVKLIRQGLSERNGHCPCVREISDDTKCMCKQFREQIADPDFEGYCHCMLYYKEK